MCFPVWEQLGANSVWICCRCEQCFRSFLLQTAAGNRSYCWSHFQLVLTAVWRQSSFLSPHWRTVQRKCKTLNSLLSWFTLSLPVKEKRQRWSHTIFLSVILKQRDYNWKKQILFKRNIFIWHYFLAKNIKNASIKAHVQFFIHTRFSGGGSYLDVQYQTFLPLAKIQDKQKNAKLN